jgi:hypothetical protein
MFIALRQPLPYGHGSVVSLIEMLLQGAGVRVMTAAREYMS